MLHERAIPQFASNIVLTFAENILSTLSLKFTAANLNNSLESDCRQFDRVYVSTDSVQPIDNNNNNRCNNNNNDLYITLV